MKKLLVLIASCMFLLSGCTKSHIVAPSLAVAPETDIKEGVEIDWGQIWDGLDETFMDPETYPMAAGINGGVDPENKYVQLTVQVKDGTSPEDAANFAMEVAKGLNDEVATQDFSYELASEKSYGGYFKENTLQIMIYPEGTYFEEDKCMLDVTIQPGEYVELKIEE